MKNLLLQIWLRRWIRICTWTALSAFLLLALLRQYMDWSGKRHYVAVRQMLTSEGVTFDFRQVVPSPVPDDKNFLATPLFSGLPLLAPEDRGGNSELARKYAALIAAALPSSNVERPSLAQPVNLGKPADLQTFASWLRKSGTLSIPPETGDPARDILAYLKKDDALVQQMGSHLDRPESQWTPSWTQRNLPDPYYSITVPQYGLSVQLSSVLCLRAMAALQLGDPASAHAALLIALRLDEANMQEPLLIGALVASSISSVVSNVTWQACFDHCGTGEDFRVLQGELNRLDFHKTLLTAFRTEMAFATNDIAYIERSREPGVISVIMPPDSTGRIPASIGLKLLPDGVFDWMAATLLQCEFDYLIQPLRDAGFPELLAKQKLLDQFLAASRNRPDAFLATLGLPPVERSTRRIIYTQTLVNQAIAACALERYRIEHGAYPDTLGAANRPGETPIPPDILTGKQMGYRKTPNGYYALWSVSFNGIDHGGTRSLDANDPMHTKYSEPDYAGDWVWDFPQH